MKPRPRWGRLYAILPLTVAAFALIEPSGLAPALGTALRGGMVGLAFGAMAWWVRANRAALDQLDWCACASSTITVRVIASRPPQRPKEAEEVAVALHS
ncbi:MAG: hypothetical protein AUH29_14635 [Candidatus Rokubacteria bacterium 13_1_40CM_69_27]|nr:MAG: hypothetical protein AUH29_14635 [Candidatus Rokubacteria bacterium 13_1_40CM_69_27]